MAWDHQGAAGTPVVFQSTDSPPAVTNLATQVASAVVTGNSVAGQVKLTSTATGGSVGAQLRIPFVDLVPNGVYAVTATVDSLANGATDITLAGISAGVFTNAGVASLYIAATTGMGVSKVAFVNYHCERVG